MNEKLKTETYNLTKDIYKNVVSKLIIDKYNSLDKNNDDYIYELEIDGEDYLEIWLECVGAAEMAIDYDYWRNRYNNVKHKKNQIKLEHNK